MNRSVIALGCTAVLSLAACGGSSESSVADTDATTATTTATTASPTTTTEPPDTTTTIADTTTTTTTEAATTTSVEAPPAIDEAQLAAFCAASEQAFLAWAVSNEIESDPASVEASLQFLTFAVSEAAVAAPPELAAEPELATTLIVEIASAIAEVDFDLDALENSSRVDELADLTTQFADIMFELEQFLVDACDATLATIDDQSIKLAQVMVEAITWPLGPIVDDTGLIRLYVPLEWTDVETFSVDDTISSVGINAAPDLASYTESWETPGVTAALFFVTPGTAEPASRIDQTYSDQCTLIGIEPYDDGLYVGELHRYGSCGGTQTALVILFATAADPPVASGDGGSATSFDVEILVDIQIPPGTDPAIADQILAIFAAG